MSIVVAIAEALDRMQAEGRIPARLLLGDREAEELERELRPFMFPPPPEDESLLPYPMTSPATVFGLPIQRVDQPSLLGVVAEGYEP